MAEVHGNPETKIQSDATPDQWLLILKDHIALTKSHARDELVQRNLDQLIALLQAAFGQHTPAGRPDREARSTLSRGDEIEADFYQLKAQEFATTPEHIRTRVLWSLGGSAPSEAEATNNTSEPINWR